MSVAGAVAASLGSASLFAAASALQHQAARAVAPSAAPSLLVTLAQRPLWLVGVGSDVGAVALQALALRWGSVALVQTLLVAGLPLAALLSAALHHRRLLGHEVRGIVLCGVGLALLGPALTPGPQVHEPSRRASVVAGAVIAAVVLVLLALRHRPRFGGALAGVAAGAVIGGGSVLLAVCAGRAGHWHALFTSWAPYAAAVVGVLGLLLAQVAFQSGESGELGAPLAALSLTEPVVAVVLASQLLHQSLPTGPGPVAAAVSGAVLSVLGVVVLCRVTPVAALGGPGRQGPP